MKKYLIVLVITLGILSIIYIFATYDNSTTLAEQLSDDSHVQELISTAIKSNEYSFLIKNHQGKLAVFDSNNTLIEIYDVFVDSLPEADIVEINKGIQIQTDQELKRLIQDYTS